MMTLFILIVGGIGGAIAGAAVHKTHVDCLRLHENTNLATKVARSGATTECFIQTPDGNWVPSERYRGTDDE